MGGMLQPMDDQILLEIFTALERHEVDYVVVGGIAVILNGIIRTTDDLDLFIPRDAANTDRLRQALQSVFADPELEQITAEAFTDDYGVLRYGPPTHDFLIDLLDHVGEAFRYQDLEWHAVDFQGVAVRVATPRTLYRMKVGTVRPEDHRDAALLARKFGLSAEG
jgi:hypothetical protein